MTSLEKTIIEKIKAEGFLPLDEYMGVCLGHPEHGYYMTRDPFGTAGDFITAPEISQIFGEMIGAWLIDTWEKLGMPQKFALVECGPGRGTLMRDILRVVKLVPNFKQAAEVYLLDMSPVLTARQKETLQGEAISWITDIKDVPQNMPVLFIGNEFLDALPVKQYEYKEKQWQERVVIVEGEQLQMACHPRESGDLVEIQKDPRLREDDAHGNGAIWETSPAVESFWHEIIQKIAKQNGAVLFIDYGYFQKRAGDTLQAVKNHKPVSIFETLGECDLTAHVDFSKLEEIAVQENMRVQKATQGDFLVRLGIRKRAELLMQKNAASAQSIAQDVRRLVEPERMGGLFKVIAVTGNIKTEGFA